jgi:hypothetical protein
MNSPEADAPIDPRRCPLCGGNNACGAAAGSTDCWCFAEKIPAEVVERVPAELRGKVCVCAACASAVRKN